MILKLRTVSLAVTVEEFSKELDGQPINLIVLDGTWREARSINHNCKFLHNLRKVNVSLSITLFTFFYTLSVSQVDRRKLTF